MSVATALTDIVLNTEIQTTLLTLFPTDFIAMQPHHVVLHQRLTPVNLVLSAKLVLNLVVLESQNSKAPVNNPNVYLVALALLAPPRLKGKSAKREHIALLILTLKKSAQQEHSDSYLEELHKKMPVEFVRQATLVTVQA